MGSVSVIIPVHNQAALTRRCIETVLPSGAAEVLVVDDASTDSSPAVLESFGSSVRTIRHAQNEGFARSCNDGAAAALGDYLLFLNNDTIPQNGWLNALVDYAESHPRAAVVGARLLYPDQTIQHAGVVICQDRYPRHVYCGFPADHPAVSQSRPFQIVTAACALVRRRAFEALGGFDPAYRNGFEDVDLCLRFGQAGHQVHYCAECRVTHLESVSPGRHQYDRDNVALYRQRWFHQVRPDDLDYYRTDGLLSFDYEGRYPLTLRASPMLASIDQDTRTPEIERILRERSRQVAGLLRENTELSLALERQAQGSPETRYQHLREEILLQVEKTVPPGATVLVISKGDGALVDLPNRRGWHFPRTEHGAYAGQHPGTSTEAIQRLEALRSQGAQYLVIPSTSRWWLDYYTEFHDHLESHCSRQPGTGDSCDIYRLDRSGPASSKP
jgi:GT2 family glycosyltransferase